MKRILSLTALLVISLASFAYADQAEMISKAEAERAEKAIQHAGNEIILFCAPCGDQTQQKITVTSLSISEVSSEGYWSVFVNDDPIDLAYTYVSKDGTWKNLGLELGLNVEEVPDELP